MQYASSIEPNFFSPSNSNGFLSFSSSLTTFDFRNASANGASLGSGAAAIANANSSDAILKASSLSGNVTFYLNTDSSFRSFIASNSSYVPTCVFWNRTSSSPFWDNTGCTVLSFNASSVLCACNHLTEFALAAKLFASSSAPPPPATPPAGPQNSNRKNVVLIATLTTLSVVFVIGGLVAFAGYKRKRKRQAGRIMVQVPATNTTQQQNTHTAASPIADNMHRDPTVLPAYQLPPSYDEHSAIKKVSGMTKFDRLVPIGGEQQRVNKLNTLMSDMNARKPPLI